MKNHILVIEDDESLAEWISEYLTRHLFDVTVLHSGLHAIESIKRINPDLIILDIMLPHRNGFEICKEAREFCKCPILMMTACSEEDDEVRSLELGADDYLTKPVRPRAMLARIRSMLDRHNEKPYEQSELTIDSMVLQKETKTVTVENASLPISGNEFDVLWLMASQFNVMIGRADLVGMLRGIQYDGFDRSIDIRISRLRKKMKEANLSVAIKTVWGKGYILSHIEPSS